MSSQSREQVETACSQQRRHHEDLDVRARVQPQLGDGDYRAVAEVPKSSQPGSPRDRRPRQEGGGRGAPHSQVRRGGQVTRGHFTSYARITFLGIMRDYPIICKYFIFLWGFIIVGSIHWRLTVHRQVFRKSHSFHCQDHHQRLGPGRLGTETHRN